MGVRMKEKEVCIFHLPFPVNKQSRSGLGRVSLEIDLNQGTICYSLLEVNNWH